MKIISGRFCGTLCVQRFRLRIFPCGGSFGFEIGKVHCHFGASWFSLIFVGTGLGSCTHIDILPENWQTLNFFLGHFPWFLLPEAGDVVSGLVGRPPHMNQHSAVHTMPTKHLAAWAGGGLGWGVGWGEGRGRGVGEGDLWVGGFDWSWCFGSVGNGFLEVVNNVYGVYSHGDFWGGQGAFVPHFADFRPRASMRKKTYDKNVGWGDSF